MISMKCCTCHAVTLFQYFQDCQFLDKKKYWCSSNWILMHRSVTRIAFLGPIMQLSLPHMHSVILNGKSNWWLIITQAARLKTNLMKHGLLWTNLYYDDQNVKTNSEMLFSRYNVSTFLDRLSFGAISQMLERKIFVVRFRFNVWTLFSSLLRSNQKKTNVWLTDNCGFETSFSHLVVGLELEHLQNWNLSTCKPEIHIFIFSRQTFDWTLITGISFVKGCVL